MQNDSDAPAVAHSKRRWWACGDVLDVSEGTWTCGLPAGHPGAQHRSDAADMFWSEIAVCNLTTGEVSVPGWLCPCRTCPRCGAVSDPDRTHPMDGLAVCLNCKPLWSSEWWASCAPSGQQRRAGVCAGSAAELEEWNAHNWLVMVGVRDGRRGWES